MDSSHPLECHRINNPEYRTQNSELEVDSSLRSERLADIYVRLNIAYITMHR
ncbi:MAG: hypothetical protein ABSG15_14315 [FCB group bacterium]